MQEILDSIRDSLSVDFAVLGAQIEVAANEFCFAIGAWLIVIGVALMTGLQS